MEALICKACGAVPLVGVAVSHAASVATAKLSVSVPVLFMVTDAGAGSAPPTVPLSARFAVDTDSTGPLAAEAYAESGAFE